MAAQQNENGKLTKRISSKQTLRAGLLALGLTGTSLALANENLPPKRHPHSTGWPALIRNRDHQPRNEMQARFSNGLKTSTRIGSFAALALPAMMLTCAQAQQRLYFEAESTPFAGNWNVAASTDGAFAGKNLQSDNTGGGNDATFVVPFAAAGTYNVWVRSRDFNTYPGTRFFQLGIDGVLFPFLAGRHGVNGWRWENVGSRTLTAQDHVITLYDTSHYYSRCDAMFLTTDATDPNSLSYATLSGYAVALRAVPFRNLDSPIGVALRFTTVGEVTNNIRALANGSALAHTPMLTAACSASPQPPPQVSPARFWTRCRVTGRPRTTALRTSR